MLRYTVELASLHPHLDLSANTYPISQTLDPASTTIVSTIAGRRSIVRAIPRRERPIVFASPVLSLQFPHHAPIAFAFSPSQKGCEKGVTPADNDDRLPICLTGARVYWSDYEELTRPILIYSKFVDLKKFCRCDTSALTAPRQRCGG